MKTNWNEYWKNQNNFFWRSWVWRITKAYKSLLKDIDLKNPKILELGSGSGINSLTIAKILKAKEVVLVDSNKTALKISKVLFKGSNLNVKYINKDILKLQLSEKFDIVHSEGVIEHFYGKNRIKILEKHKTFCKRGGFIVVFVPYRSFRYGSFRLLCKALGKWILWDEYLFSKEELYKLCRQLDLKIIKEYTSLLIHEVGLLMKKT